MAYPRRCPLCGGNYQGPLGSKLSIGVVCDAGHATLSAVPGGTPSSWRPRLPGRLLTLRCLACRGEYAWDYFGGRPAGGVAPPLRPPQQAASPRRRSLALPGSRLRP